MNPLRAKVSRPVCRLLPVCVLLCAFGCEMQEYRDRVDVQRKRLDFLDEENRSLTEPIDNPKYETKESGKVAYWPFDVFLRPPREFATSTSANSSSGALPLFRFSGREGVYLFVAAGLIAEKKDPKGKESKPAPSEWPVETFRNNVRGALLDSYIKEKNVNPKFPAIDEGDLFLKQFPKFTLTPRNEYGEKLSPIDFNAGAFVADTARFDIYFHQNGNKQAAVVFQYPVSLANDEQLKKGIDGSLKTFGIGTDGANKRVALHNRRNFKR
jgi:hypothetical protein